MPDFVVKSNPTHSDALSHSAAQRSLEFASVWRMKVTPLAASICPARQVYVLDAAAEAVHNTYGNVIQASVYDYVDTFVRKS